MLIGNGRPTTQWIDCKGPRPLLEVQEAKPPGGFEGDALAPGRRRRLPRRAPGVRVAIATVCDKPERFPEAGREFGLCIEDEAVRQRTSLLHERERQAASDAKPAKPRPDMEAA